MKKEFDECGLIIDNIIQNRKQTLKHVRDMIVKEQFDSYTLDELKRFEENLICSIELYKEWAKIDKNL